MNKKLLAVAVAGLVAAPSAALAQTTVTITGLVKATFGQFKMSNRADGAASSSGESLVRDESSRVIFLVREDLGGGLAAIGKIDVRYATSESNIGQASGETYVGLTSPSWGTIALGKFDFHYGNSASFTGVHAGLQTNPTAIMDRAAAGTVAVANQTRTQNAIRYGSPKFGNMFEVVVGYSANATAASTAAAGGNEADYASGVRKGSAWNINPKLFGANWEAGYSYWSSKPDAQAGGIDKQRGDSLYGWYKWGGLRVGLAYNRSKLTGVAGGVTFDGSNRTAWGLPISYNWGNHTIYADFNRARADKAAIFDGADTKANFFGLTYAYDLSKRTAVAMSYSRIKNGEDAAYGLFAQQQATTFGEDPRFIGVTLQHRF